MMAYKQINVIWVTMYPYCMASKFNEAIVRQKLNSP